MTVIQATSRLALVGIAALSFAACSSTDASLKGDAKKLSNELAAATKAENKAAKAEQAASTTTTAAPAPSCPTQAEATVILGAGNLVISPLICENGFAAGDASSQVDYAYILQLDGGNWTRASDAVASEICTTNPQGLSKQFVSTGCND